MHVRAGHGDASVARTPAATSFILTSPKLV